jgi:hypothetical protein
MMPRDGTGSFARQEVWRRRCPGRRCERAVMGPVQGLGNCRERPRARPSHWGTRGCSQCTPASPRSALLRQHPARRRAGSWLRRKSCSGWWRFAFGAAWRGICTSTSGTHRPARWPGAGAASAKKRGMQCADDRCGLPGLRAAQAVAERDIGLSPAAPRRKTTRSAARERDENPGSHR